LLKRDLKASNAKELNFILMVTGNLFISKNKLYSIKK